MCNENELLEKLKEELSESDAQSVVDALDKHSNDIEKIKSTELDKVSKQSGASIVAMAGDLKKENLSIGSLDKILGNIALKRKQPVAVASSGSGTFKAVNKTINSSGLEDYPNSIIDIDEIGNWKKVNKATGQVDWVHVSGSKLSFYKNGDVILHTAANLKQVVENDYILEVGRNFELTTGKEIHITSKENMFLTSEGNLFESIKNMKLQKVPNKIQESNSISITSPSWYLKGNATVSDNINAKDISSQNHSASESTIGHLTCSSIN